MLVFIFMNKIKQNYQNYFSLSNKKSCLILRIELCSLFFFLTRFSATGTPSGLGTRDGFPSTLPMRSRAETSEA